MRSEAVVEVELRGGRSVCTTLRSAPPVSVRATPEAVYLVASAAGPVGGDSLTVRVRVGEGAHLTLRSVGAGLALPGPTAEPAEARLDVEVATGGRARLLVAPQIVAAGADLRSTTSLRLAAGARLWWRDEVVLGRHAEPAGSVAQRLRVQVEDRPVLACDLRAGPAWPASEGPAGTAGARALGTILSVGPARPPGDPGAPRAAGAHRGVLPVRPPAVEGARGEVLDLGPDRWMASALAPGASALAAWLDGVAAPPEVLSPSGAGAVSQGGSPRPGE